MNHEPVSLVETLGRYLNLSLFAIVMQDLGFSSTILRIRAVGTELLKSLKVRDVILSPKN